MDEADGRARARRRAARHARRAIGRPVGGLSVRELERVRDDNLVALLHALRAEGYGAGACARGARAAPFRRRARRCRRPPDPTRPLALHDAVVRHEWVDYNGHMTEARYAEVLGNASDAFLRHVGFDAGYLEAGHSFYTVESHIRYLAEVAAGEPLATTTQVLGADAEAGACLPHALARPHRCAARHGRAPHAPRRHQRGSRGSDARAGRRPRRRLGSGSWRLAPAGRRRALRRRAAVALVLASAIPSPRPVVVAPVLHCPAERQGTAAAPTSVRAWLGYDPRTPRRRSLAPNRRTRGEQPR